MRTKDRPLFLLHSILCYSPAGARTGAESKKLRTQTGSGNSHLHVGAKSVVYRAGQQRRLVHV